MLEDLAAIAEEAAAARVFVLTGEGSVFSAGADLDEARNRLTTDPVWERLSAAIAAHPGLTIAALNGTVAGGAVGMVLACDIRVAVDGAKFFYPVMKNGFLPQPSDPGRLTALIGPAKAKLILMSGVKASTQEAKDWGLFDVVCDRDKLTETVDALTADVLSAPLPIVTGIKALFR